MVKKKSPKPPRVVPSSTISINPIKKSLWQKIKIKKNNILNKYYYTFVDKYTVKINELISNLINEILKFIRLLIWAGIILLILQLLKYDLNYLNYFSSVAIVLVVSPVVKFIYKLCKVEE